MSDPTEGPQSNVSQLTQSFMAIPPERFQKKLGRSAAGIALVICGLKGLPYLKAAEISNASLICEVAVILGAVMCSFEFIVAPLRFLLAFAKDAVALVRGFKNGGTS